MSVWGSREKREEEKRYNTHTHIHTPDNSLNCPQCGSKLLYRDGIRYLSDGSQAQRWLCRGCFYRFVPESSKRRAANDGLRECAEQKDPKNSLSLVSGMTENSERTTRENLQGRQDDKEKLLAYSWHLAKQNYSVSTVKTFTSILKKLSSNGADLDNPESVKETLTRLKTSPNSKVLIVAAYTSFLKFQNRSWVHPRYKRQEKIAFIPTEKEIDDLISGCSRTISAILLALKETGARIGEICKLKWTEINTESDTISINEPEKGSNSRIIKVSARLISVLEALPRKDEKVFGKSSKHDKQVSLQIQRLALSGKLANPRLAQIKFHTLRHWKATMEYHETKDIVHVKRLLGHKRIENTMKYIDIEQAIFQETNDKFHVRAVDSLDEACKLIEVGYEFVTEVNGKKVFRKRK